MTPTRPPTPAQLEVLQALTRLGGAGMTDLARHIPDVAPSSLKDRLKGLQGRGLVELRSRRWHVTPEGVAALTAAPVVLPASSLGVPGVGGVPFPAHPGWARLMEALPLPELRGLLRLTLAVSLLRQCAPQLGPMPWLGAYGPPGTGKTTTGEAALHLMGGRLFKVGTMTAGEAIGRRVQTSGGYTIDPLPQTLSGPVTVLDELAEADPALERAVFALVDMGRAVKIEGLDLEQRAAVFATWNPEGRTVPLSPGATRRGLLLDVTPHTARLTRAFTRDLAGVEVREVLDAHPGPWFDLTAYTVPPLAQDAIRGAQRLLFDLLTPQGRQDIPISAVGPLGASYAVMLGLDPDAALFEAVGDMVLITATRPGLLVPAWRELMGGARASVNLPHLDPPTPPETVNALRVLEQQATEKGHLGRLLQRVRNARAVLQGVTDSTLTPAELEDRAERLRHLELISERGPHVPAQLHPDLEVLIDQQVQLCDLWAQKVTARLGEAHTAHAAQLAQLEQGKKQAKGQRDVWRTVGKRWRAATGANAEDVAAAMQEAVKLGAVKMTRPALPSSLAPIPAQALPSSVPLQVENPLKGAHPVLRGVGNVLVGLGQAAQVYHQIKAKETVVPSPTLTRSPALERELGTVWAYPKTEKPILEPRKWLRDIGAPWADRMAQHWADRADEQNEAISEHKRRARDLPRLPKVLSQGEGLQ